MTGVDAAKFVAVWLKHARVKDVAAELGIPAHDASVFAVRLRRAGVNLPKKVRGASVKNIDVSGLNATIKKAGQ